MKGNALTWPDFGIFYLFLLFPLWSLEDLLRTEQKMPHPPGGRIQTTQAWFIPVDSWQRRQPSSFVGVFVTCFVILQCNTFTVICRFPSINPVGQEKKHPDDQGYFFMEKLNASERPSNTGWDRETGACWQQRDGRTLACGILSISACVNFAHSRSQTSENSKY